jgi:protein TonB
MPASVSSPPDVFTAREIARAAGASSDDVHALVESGQVVTLDGRFVAAAEAVRAVRLLRGEAERLAPNRSLFQPRPAAARKAGMPLVASGTLHLAMIGMIALMTALGLRGQTVERVVDSKPTRLVFLVRPGPGGGGGGGGLRRPMPAPRAEKKGKNAIRSPIPVQRVARVARPEPVKRQPPPPPPPVATPVERPVEPPPAPAPDPTPPVVAPVASVAADTKEQTGVLTDAPVEVPSQGPGTGGGAGTGNGTGIGEGEGTGIGPGSGGGTGGGPYRPGSGVTPPTLLTEIKPDYTEAARRSGITGDVVLEIVVRSDGSVGAIKLLSGLGSGLDQRAIDAVRRWRFSPARRHGTPVDVLVEVAVEFRLR